MLKLINLYVIQNILSSVAVHKLTASCQMLYINCLIFHFSKLPPIKENSMAFFMFESDFPSYEKYRGQMQQLAKATLISLDGQKIIFNNFWSPFIDPKGYEMPLAGEEAPWPRLASSMEKDILANQSFCELMQMKHSLSAAHLTKLVALFVKEQDTFKKTYSSTGDCIKHCTYWMVENHTKMPKESVKSGAKLLGT